MMDEIAQALEVVERASPSHCILIVDPPSGLRAFIVLDDLTLGPAAGGVRTRSYPSAGEALEDAFRLARAMTLKCALASVDAGGGKCVVMDHAGLDRPRAFEELGRRIEGLRGAFRTAGDLGTTSADLQAMARGTRYVYEDDRGLVVAAARGLLRCVEACAAERGMRGVEAGVEGLRVAVQGVGAIGAAVAEALAKAGARVLCADIDGARAADVARSIGGATCAPEDVLLADVDIVAPCAAGGVLTEDVARRLRAWAVCGAANNILASPEAARVLAERGILHVPDPIASAGAVTEGIARELMSSTDPTPLIDKLGETAREVLREARATGRTATEVAEAVARRRLRRGNSE